MKSSVLPLNRIISEQTNHFDLPDLLSHSEVPEGQIKRDYSSHQWMNVQVDVLQVFVSLDGIAQ